MSETDLARLRDEVAGVLAPHGGFESVSGGFRCHCGVVTYETDAHLADALLPLLARMLAEARVEALRLVRLVESDMSEQAFKAWRSADARRGLSDHEALIVHADALTRWSERLRMAFEGQDYRDRDTEGPETAQNGPETAPGAPNSPRRVSADHRDATDPSEER